MKIIEFTKILLLLERRPIGDWHMIVDPSETDMPDRILKRDLDMLHLKPI